MKTPLILLAIVLLAPGSSEANRKSAKPAAGNNARQKSSLKSKGRINRLVRNHTQVLSHDRGPFRPSAMVAAGTPSAKILSFAAPKGTKVDVSVQQRSANVGIKDGKVTSRDVTKAQRWKRLTSYTVSSHGSTTEHNGPVIAAGAPVKLQYKDTLNRRSQKVETATKMGGQADGAPAWVNPNNIWVSHPSKAPGIGDYQQRAITFEKRAASFEKSLGKRPTKDQANDLHYLQTVAKEAKREFGRLQRIAKTVSFLEGRAKIKNTDTSALTQQINKLRKQLPSGHAESRFVALAAFPANAEVTLSNPRRQEAGHANFELTLKANASGSVSGAIPAWLHDQIKMKVSTSREGSAAHYSTFTIPSNKESKGAFEVRGKQYNPLE